MLTIEKCINLIQEWIKENKSNQWFLKAILEHNNEYLVVICINNKDGKDSLVILSMHKNISTFEHFYYLNEVLLNKIKESKVVYGEFNIEEYYKYQDPIEKFKKDFIAYMEENEVCEETIEYLRATSAKTLMDIYLELIIRDDEESDSQAGLILSCLDAYSAYMTHKAYYDEL